MIEKELALEIKKRSLNAMEILFEILKLNESDWPSEDSDWIRRGIGISVGDIQSRLLDHVYEQYPELDPDLKGPQ